MSETRKTEPDAAGGSMMQLVVRLREACNGHPHAKIPWPHRILHEAADEIEDMAKRIRLQCDEWAEDHTHLQNLCREAGCSDLEIEGDNYGVPGIIDLANSLRDRLSSHNSKLSEPESPHNHLNHANVHDAPAQQRQSHGCSGAGDSPD